jgi:hypothetical protein
MGCGPRPSRAFSMILTSHQVLARLLVDPRKARSAHGRTVALPDTPLLPGAWGLRLLYHLLADVESPSPGRVGITRFGGSSLLLLHCAVMRYVSPAFVANSRTDFPGPRVLILRPPDVTTNGISLRTRQRPPSLDRMRPEVSFRDGSNAGSSVRTICSRYPVAEAVR